MIEQQQTTAGLAELLRGAAILSQAGNRTAAIAALDSAVALAPDDRTAHRRLAAAYANAGDIDRARSEYDRFVARLQARSCPDAAAAEQAYAAMLFAARPTVSSVPARRGRLTDDQWVALRRIGVAVVAIAATMAVMLAAGAQIFASGGPL